MRLFTDQRAAPGSWWSPGPSRTEAAGMSDGDRLLLAALVGVAAVVALVAATGHLAAAAFDGAWPRYRLVDLPGIVGRVVARPGDPGRAWDPVNASGAPPGPLACGRCWSSWSPPRRAPWAPLPWPEVGSDLA